MDRLRKGDLPQGHGSAEIDSLTGILLSDIVNETQRRKKMLKKLKKVLSLDNENRVSREEFMQLIQKKSYELYEKRGCQQGNDLEDWINAERLVKEDLGLK